jgi:hypothetical protein
MKTYSVTVFINANDSAEADRKVSKLKDDKAVFVTKAKPWGKKPKSIWKMFIFG